MLCYQCLKKIPENSRKCPFCGRLLIPGHPEETTSKPAPEKPAKTKPAPEKPAHPKAPPPELTPTEPGPVKPAKAKPTTAEPGPIKPAPIKPAPEKPIPVKTVPTKPAPKSPARTIPEPPVSPPVEPLALYNIGDIIANRYEVWEILGSGGLGTVYKVQDRGTRRSFILKRILLELINPAVIDRFQKEAATWNKIRHPHLVEVYAYGEDRGSVYFLREYLEGLSLDRLLTVRKNAGVPFSIEEVDPIFSQIALGLDELHRTTFHGDLKPQNIIILPDTLKITDFGIGRMLENPDFISSQLAQGDNYYYLAPELISDPKHTGKCSDIYSLGSILQEMLTNSVPRGENLAPSQLNPNLGPTLDPIVTRALREIYSERYENILDFARDFYQALGKKLPEIFSPQSIDDLPIPDDFMDIQSSRVLGRAVKSVPEILPSVAAAKPFTPPEPPAPKPIRISEPPVSEQIDIHEPPAPEPVFIPEPPAPEPVFIPEPPAPEPVFIPEPPAPEPVFIPEPPAPEPVFIPEPPAPEPVFIPEPPAPEPIPIPESPAPEPIFIPEPPAPEPPAPEPVFIPEPSAPEPVFIPEPPAPEPVFIPEPPAPEPVFIPEPPAPEPVFIPEPPAPEPVFIPEPPAPEPVFIPEPPAPEPIPIPESPAPEPIFIPEPPAPEPPAPEPVFIPEPSAPEPPAPEPVFIPEPPAPEPIPIPEPPAPEPVFIPEPPAPEPIFIPEPPAPEPPAPEPVFIPEPPAPEPIPIPEPPAPEPPAPEPVFIPEPPAPEPVFIPEPSAPEPVFIPEPPTPEPVFIPEPPAPEPVFIPEPPAPEPVFIPEPSAPEPPAPEPVFIPEPPAPEPIPIPEPPAPEPPAPETVFIPEPPAPEPIPIPEPPAPEPVFIPEPPAPEPIFIPEPPAPEPPAPEPQIIPADLSSSFPPETEIRATPSPGPSRSKAPLIAAVLGIIIVVVVGGYFLTNRQKNSRLALEIKEESQAIIKTYREMEQAGAGRKNISLFLKAGPRIEDMKKLLAAEEYEKVQAVLPAIAALVDEAQTELEEKQREEEKKNSAGAEEIVRQAETSQLDAAKAQAQAEAPELFKEGSTKLEAARKALAQGKIPEAIALGQASQTAFDQAAKKAAKKAPPAEPEKEVKTAQAKKEATAAATAGKCPDRMAYIPAGSFPMGSSPDDPDHDYSELSNKSVNVPAYCIDVYEYPNKEGALPRTKSTWSEAKKTCQANGNRLCTEPEWEKACKGTKNNKYPYGNTWDGNICNTQDPQGKERAVLASGKEKKCKSDYGVYDLSGNVKEWTEDAFSPEISDRTVKGGSSSRPDWATRCATRENFLHPVRNPDLGFRCCRDAP